MSYFILPVLRRAMTRHIMGKLIRQRFENDPDIDAMSVKFFFRTARQLMGEPLSIYE